MLWLRRVCFAILLALLTWSAWARREGPPLPPPSPLPAGRNAAAYGERPAMRSPAATSPASPANLPPPADPAPPAPAPEGCDARPLMDPALARRLRLSDGQTRAAREAIVDFLDRGRDAEALEARLRAILDPEQYALLSRAREERRASARERCVSRELARAELVFGLDPAQLDALGRAMRAFFDGRRGTTIPPDSLKALLLSVPALRPDQVRRMSEHLK